MSKCEGTVDENALFLFKNQTFCLGFKCKSHENSGF